MPLLYAPAGLRSLGIGDDDYVVAADGTVEVGDDHVAEAMAHGCRHDKPVAEAPAAPDLVPGRIDEIETRVAALEARLTQLEAARPRKGG
ncbi:MAG TPA: hypothetical protein VKS60_00275 [Stellaceae bacterium]|nr:hypothetical protein [Stellaceae bacterium]